MSASESTVVAVISNYFYLSTKKKIDKLVSNSPSDMFLHALTFFCALVMTLATTRIVASHTGTIALTCSTAPIRIVAVNVSSCTPLSCAIGPMNTVATCSSQTLSQLGGFGGQSRATYADENCTVLVELNSWRTGECFRYSSGNVGSESRTCFGDGTASYYSLHYSSGDCSAVGLISNQTNTWTSDCVNTGPGQWMRHDCASTPLVTNNPTGGGGQPGSGQRTTLLFVPWLVMLAIALF
jgi:hypothetical protein